MLAFGILFALIIAACSAATPVPATPSPAASPVVATALPTLAVSEAPTDEATLAATTSAAGRTFVIADVGSTPTTSIKAFQPLADYLTVKLAPAGVTAVTIKVAPDFDTIAKWLKDGEVDLLFQTPYPAVLLENAVGAKTILRRWKNGDATYKTVIFAKADSGMKTIMDLKGKMLAVQDEFSTSAYMMPLAYIAEQGIKIATKATPDASVAADEIGYTNSHSDDNTLQWVVSGKTAAGAAEFRVYNSLPDDTRKQLIILGQTEELPRGVVMVQPNMDPQLQSLLSSVLVGMDQTDEGRAVLVKTQNTTHFDELPGGPDAALAETRRLTKVLQGAIGK
jgi:phosphonate transport system substrate-binding protein